MPILPLLPILPICEKPAWLSNQCKVLTHATLFLMDYVWCDTCTGEWDFILVVTNWIDEPLSLCQ